MLFHNQYFSWSLLTETSCAIGTCKTVRVRVRRVARGQLDSRNSPPAKIELHIVDLVDPTRYLHSEAGQVVGTCSPGGTYQSAVSVQRNGVHENNVVFGT